MTTVTLIAMKLFLAPSSLKVGCGQISCFLLALDETHGKSTDIYTQKTLTSIMTPPRFKPTHISQRFNTILCFSDTTSVTKHFPLPESITTWQFTGISLSTTHGENSVTESCFIESSNLELVQSLKSSLSLSLCNPFLLSLSS